MDYKKYAPLKSFLYYITITCQKFSFALFLKLLVSVKTFFGTFRRFWLVTLATGYHFGVFLTFLKPSKSILPFWMQAIDLRALSKLWG